MNKLFSFPGGDWIKSEFDEAMNGLINKGLAERVMVEGKEFFCLTSAGESVSVHMHTDPSTRN